MLVGGALPVYPVQLPTSVVAFRFTRPVRYAPTRQRKSHHLREIAGVRGLPHTEIHSRYSGVTWRNECHWAMLALCANPSSGQ